MRMYVGAVRANLGVSVARAELPLEVSDSGSATRLGVLEGAEKHIFRLYNYFIECKISESEHLTCIERNIDVPLLPRPCDHRLGETDSFPLQHLRTSAHSAPGTLKCASLAVKMHVLTSTTESTVTRKESWTGLHRLSVTCTSS